MRSLKSILAAAAVASSLGVGGVALTSTPAMAYVACNGAGECWHTDRRYRYDHGAAVVIHPDDWYFHQRWNGNWRDYHEGRGYYRGGVWIPF